MGRLTKNRPSVRLSLEMDKSVREALEKLRDDTKADTLAEVIRRSLAVYKMIWAEHEAGAKIIIRREDGDVELMIL